MTSAKGTDKARAEESPIHAVLAGLEEGAKYEDPDFPASAASLGAWTDGAGSTEVVWLRPEEFKRTDYAPGRLFGDGVEPDDVEQGALGDDGLCAALVALAECSTRVRALFRRHAANAHGVYCVTLCGRDGALRDVLVDDRVPCDARTRAPLFAHCRRGELWAPLVEKALAKARGSYAALRTGSAGAVLAALTGAPCHTHAWTPGALAPADVARLWDAVARHDRLDHVLCCHVASIGSDTGAGRATTGLVGGRWHALLEARAYGDAQLLRVRDTRSRLAGGSDWTGAWGSTDAAHWTAATCDALGRRPATDGSFWIPVADWAAHCDTLCIAEVECGWNIQGCSVCVPPFTAETSSTNGNTTTIVDTVAATITAEEDTVAAVTLHQRWDAACGPARLCVVTAARPHLPLGGTARAGAALQTVSTGLLHVPPGTYFVVVGAAAGTHGMAVSTYSPSAALIVCSVSADSDAESDVDATASRNETGFVLPEDWSVRGACCALCGAPVPAERAVCAGGLRVHAWCERCDVCGGALGPDAAVWQRGVGRAARLRCRHCAERDELRQPRGEAVRAEVQQAAARIAAPCTMQEQQQQHAAVMAAAATATAAVATGVGTSSREDTLSALALSKERLKRARHVRAQADDAAVRAVFHVVDHNGDGAIDSAEMVGLLQSAGMCLSPVPAIQRYQVKRVMDEADRSAPTLSLKKFCRWYQHADWQELDENMQYLERVARLFLSFDKNGNSTLERDELVALHARLVEEGITKRSFDQLFEKLDKNHTDRIELNEFVEWFQK